MKNIVFAVLSVLAMSVAGAGQQAIKLYTNQGNGTYPAGTLCYTICPDPTLPENHVVVVNIEVAVWKWNKFTEEWDYSGFLPLGRQLKGDDDRQDPMPFALFTIPPKIAGYVDGKGEVEFQVAAVDGTDANLPWSHCVFDNVADITVSEGIGRVGGRLFSWCDNIRRVTLPSSLKKIDDTAFLYSTGLSSVNLADTSVEDIGESAFGGCSALQQPVKIPPTIKVIRDYAFAESDITALDLPDVPYSIGACAFMRCHKLLEIETLGGCTNLGAEAFAACENIVRVEIPASIRHIPQWAFRNCGSLRDVVFAEGLESIDVDAFLDCPLRDFVLPDGVLDVRSFPCYGKLSVPQSVTNLSCSGDSRCYPRDMTVSRLWPSVTCKYATNIVVKPGIASIPYSYFANCHRLQSISLPDTIREIGISAFYGCTNLTYAAIPKSTCVIGSNAFKGCVNLPSLAIPESIGDIGDFAFSGCEKISCLTIPNSVTNVGYGAFSGCSGLVDVKLPQCVCDLKLSTVFPSAYLSITNVTVLYGVTRIGAEAFSECGSMSKVVIPCTVGSVERRAFYGCSSLAEIVLDGDAPVVGDDAFAGVQCAVTVNPWRNGWDLSLSATWNGLPVKYSTPVAFFDVNGGDGDFPPLITEGGVFTNSLPVAVRTGYSFLGWWDARNNGSMIDEACVFDESSMLFAHWAANKYMVAFDANCGDGGCAYELEYDSAIVPPVVVREGYTFLGWSPEVAAAVPASNVTYTAQWKLNEYTIMLNLNGGEGESAVVVKHGSVVGDIPVPAKALSEFAGWFTAAEGGERVDESVTITGAMELFAHWNRTHYAVSFDANGGFLAAEDATVFVEAGGALGDRALPVPTKDGQLFIGWFTSEDDGERIEIDAAITDDVTYYAHWIPKSTILIGVDESYMAEADGSFALALGDIVFSGSTLKITLKGLPSGLKFDAKTMTISGKATKPGTYKVTVSATNATVKKPVTAEFEIVVPNLASKKLPGLKPETGAYGVVMCGVAFDPGLVDCTPENGWTVKVAGLPAGLKFTAKDIMKKGSKTEVEIPANTIYGVATKAGTFTVTFTATRGKERQTATITLNVEALPTWATGTFAGSVKCKMENVKLEEAETFGFATMTIAANGKISGKIALEGTNWTFSAASYAAVRRAGVIAPYQNGGEECFIVEAEAKAGKATMPVVLEVAACDGGGTGGALGDRALPNAVVEGTFGEGEVKMWRNMWKDKATASEAKATIAGFEGVYTVSIADGAAMCGSGYLSLTVGKNGDVKASGKLADGTGVSTTSPLVYDEDAGWLVMLYAAPSAYKGGCFAAAVGFDDRLASVLFTPMWTSKNPQATGEYGEGFAREVDLSGAYYNKTKALNDHYNALKFSAEQPTLNGVDPENGGEAEITIDAKGKPVIDKASGLTLSFAQATGIFKGGYTFVFDAKTKKKVSFEGILVQGEEPKMDGFYLWDAAGVYKDPKTNKDKAYKYKQSYPVTCEGE